MHLLIRGAIDSSFFPGLFNHKRSYTQCYYSVHFCLSDTVQNFSRKLYFFTDLQGLTKVNAETYFNRVQVPNNPVQFDYYVLYCVYACV